MKLITCAHGAAHGAARRAALGVAAVLAPCAFADPGTLVGFSWLTTGETSASASAACLAPNPPPGCVVDGGCDSPTPSFAVGGSSMAALNQSVTARSACVFRCTCCLFGGGTGQGDSRSDYLLREAVTSETQTRWSFGDTIYAGAAVAGETYPGCVSGSGAGDALTTYRFDLTFDATGTTRLYFVRSNSVQAESAGGSASAITLSRVGGPVLFTESLNSAAGSQYREGVAEFALTAGRYTLHVEGSAHYSAAAPGGSVGGFVQAAFTADLFLTPYDCPLFTDEPDSVAVGPGATASFSVAATGSALFYQWRKDGVPLSNGPTGTGSGIIGALGPNLSVSNVGPADAGGYDCVISNLCGQPDSADAGLFVLCTADVDDGSGSGTPDGGVTIEDLLYYLNIFDQGLLAADVDDGSGTGTQDGGVTIDDLLYYLARFDAGC